MPQDSMTTSYKMAEKSRMLYIKPEILSQVHDFVYLYRACTCSTGMA